MSIKFNAATVFIALYMIFQSQFACNGFFSFYHARPVKFDLPHGIILFHRGDYLTGARPMENEANSIGVK